MSLNISLKNLNSCTFRFVCLSSIFLSSYAMALSSSAPPTEAPHAGPQATYTVPLPPHLIEELGDVATLPLAQPKITQQPNGMTRLDYRLPAELVGKNYPTLTFHSQSYSQNEFQIIGENGKGTCARPQPESQISCFIEYNDLNIDLKNVESHLKSIAGNPNELRRRLTLAARFAGDPVGILKY